MLLQGSKYGSWLYIINLQNFCDQEMKKQTNYPTHSEKEGTLSRIFMHENVQNKKISLSVFQYVKITAKPCFECGWSAKLSK